MEEVLTACSDVALCTEQTQGPKKHHEIEILSIRNTLVCNLDRNFHSPPTVVMSQRAIAPLFT